ncbi:MAG: hypothetical protein HY057_04425, partial [Rhodospirillales bacterium]|nr:hypothetical protein [Rhodospirillales bacterium]
MLGGKYNKLFDKLRDALSTAESGPAPTAARTPVAKKAPGLPPASGTEFDKQFARVCSEQQSIIGGKVQ